MKSNPSPKEKASTCQLRYRERGTAAQRRYSQPAQNGARKKADDWLNIYQNRRGGTREANFRECMGSEGRSPKHNKIPDDTSDNAINVPASKACCMN